MEIGNRPHMMIYGRTGIMSARTELNRGLADQFMCISGLKRGVVFVDSNKELDVLERLGRRIPRFQRYHQTRLDKGVYMVQIHERMIDHDIRTSDMSADCGEYERRFVFRLRKEIKGALAEVLFREKFGVKDQAANWGLELIVAAYYLSPAFQWDNEQVPLFVGLAALVLVGHPLINFFSSKLANEMLRPNLSANQKYHPRNDNLLSRGRIFLPPFPIGEYIRSRRFLANHANELVVVKE